MSDTPEFTRWQDLLSLLALDDNTKQPSPEQLKHLEFVLSVLLTPDERETVLSRMNIVFELLEGRRSQRQISQLLGVGIATVTRGSNQLKNVEPEKKQQLQDLLEAVQQLDLN